MFLQRKFNVQTSLLLINYNINILLKFLVFNDISVTKSVFVLFPMFSSENRLGKALNFDTVQSTILNFIERYCAIHDVTGHVQS